MRDIRADLRERLEALAAEKSNLQHRIDHIAGQEVMVQILLKSEEDRIARLTVPRAELPFPLEEEAPPGGIALLGNLIKHVMSVRNRPLAMEEIRDEILTTTKFNFGEKKPGRAVHFGLVSLMNGGEVVKLPNGRWELLPIPNGKVPVQEARTTN